MKRIYLQHKEKIDQFSGDKSDIDIDDVNIEYLFSELDE